MEMPLHVPKRAPLSWRTIESLIDRTIRALEQADFETVVEIARECEAINLEVAADLGISECTDRLQWKKNMLGKLLAHTQANINLLHRFPLPILCAPDGSTAAREKG